MDGMDDDLVEAESTLGPGFDLIVGLLAVILVALQLSRASLASALGGETDLTYVAESKIAFVRALCAKFGAIQPACTNYASQSANSGTLAIPVSLADGRQTNIEIEDIGTNQTLRIGNEVLFESGKSMLTLEGRAALKNVIEIVSICSSVLREVQIQGHADRQPYLGKGGNLQLASDRAISVYGQFIQNGVDPRNLLLSAATYDSFKPVDRQPGQPYDWAAWALAPDEVLRSNRRVEFHLIYQLAPSGSTSASCKTN